MAKTPNAKKPELPSIPRVEVKISTELARMYEEIALFVNQHPTRLIEAALENYLESLNADAVAEQKPRSHAKETATVGIVTRDTAKAVDTASVSKN
jgi:hypothetical protein